MFGLAGKPDHLVVVGNGASAIETAQAFRRLGSQATVIGPAAALGEYDAEMAAPVLRRVRAEGVAVLEQAKVISVERSARGGIRLAVETPGGPAAIEGSHLLVASGWRPDAERLD